MTKLGLSTLLLSGIICTFFCQEILALVLVDHCVENNEEPRGASVTVTDQNFGRGGSIQARFACGMQSLCFQVGFRARDKVPTFRSLPFASPNIDRIPSQWNQIKSPSKNACDVGIALTEFL